MSCSGAGAWEPGGGGEVERERGGGGLASRGRVRS